MNNMEEKKDEISEVSKSINNNYDNILKSIEDFKAGKMQALGFLVGQVMAKTKGQANPKIVNEILRKKLN